MPRDSLIANLSYIFLQVSGLDFGPGLGYGLQGSIRDTGFGIQDTGLD